MAHILYTIFIFPIEQLIALAYVFVFRVFDNPALSVLGVSFVVSVFTLPLYFMAETLQRSERDIQKKMKPDVDNIKAVFSGDERFMRLATYYRQNNYHPFYSLRSSVSILIQIPFFIAAYHFLSNATMLANVSFGPIKDLSKPDALVTIHGTAINVLPVIMTLVNCVSSAIYAKGFSAREKVQLYGMAGIFLVLLYNSPSALVLYWTGNNLFSLVKNVIQKTRCPKIITFTVVSVICLSFAEYIAFFHDGWVVKRFFAAHLAVLVPLSLYAVMFMSEKWQNTFIIKQNNGSEKSGSLFVLSVLVLFLLGGLVIPSSLIRTSVVEFSFVESFESPFHFLAEVLFQSIGIFLIWPLCVYCMSSFKMRKILATASVILSFVAIVNAFLFSGNYGFLTEMFTFSENVSSGRIAMLGNLLFLSVAAVLVLLLLKHFRRVILPILTIAICALVFSGVANSVDVYKEFQVLRIQAEKNNVPISDSVFHFSKTGKNVVVIMLDRAMAGYVPYIFEEKPELHRSLDGFTLYKNTVSYGGATNFCSAAVFGGYEYTPLEMQARNTIPLVKKQNEALLLLPRIFLDQGFNVTVTDPMLANYRWLPDLSIFDDYPEINARNLIGAYTKDWLRQNHRQELVSNTAQTIEDRLIRFSFFKFMPLIFRIFAYDDGNWLTTKRTYKPLSEKTLSTYVHLDVLSQITKIDNTDVGTYNVLCNDLTHEPAFLQAPDYTLTNNSTDIGAGPFASEDHYHVNMAALLLLGKWFDFLKENDVYDNSRIIIVADHGRTFIDSKFPDNIVLPNERTVQAYNPLFLVKDFSAHGDLVIDNSFMTNADVPIIALDGLVESPVNPFTGKRLVSDKADGVTITISRLWDVAHHPENTFDIKPDEWLHVHDNIFDPKNWSLVTK